MIRCDDCGQIIGKWTVNPRKRRPKIKQLSYEHVAVGCQIGGEKAGHYKLCSGCHEKRFGRDS